jgi:hypothetical protein
MISDGPIFYFKNFPPESKPNERFDPGDLLAVSLDYGSPLRINIRTTINQVFGSSALGLEN